MVNVLISSDVGRRFEPWLGHTTNYEIGILCFSAKHTALRSKNNDLLGRNQNNLLELSRLLFQWASTIKILFSVLDIIIIISSKYNLILPLYSWKIAHFVKQKKTITHSLTQSLLIMYNMIMFQEFWITGPIVIDLFLSHLDLEPYNGYNRDSPVQWNDWFVQSAVSYD